MSRAQIKKLVNHLNSMSTDQRLDYEWEVVLLNAFSKVGKVEYEKKFSGSSYVDIFFAISENPKNNFLAEITTVSDRRLEDINPVEALSDTLYKEAKKCGVWPISFHLEVGAHQAFFPKDRYKVKLKLPGRVKFKQSIFNDDFKRFMKEILNDPATTHEYSVNTADIDVKISYSPSQEGGRTHLCYTSVYSLTENRIYDALKRKLPQLRKSGFDGPIGIFLCDGGCSLFTQKPRHERSPNVLQRFSIGDIIKRFLADNSEVSFVVTVTTERKNPTRSLIPPERNPYMTFIDLFKGQKFDQMELDLRSILKEVDDVLPVPQFSPYTAVNYLKEKNPNVGLFYVGNKMNFKENFTSVAISARTLFEVLAGTLNQEDFFRRTRFLKSGAGGETTTNPFNFALGKGQTIKKVSITKSDSADDDWIEFELEPDAAISPFKTPAVKK